jgi:hypothetical protein
MLKMELKIVIAVELGILAIITILMFIMSLQNNRTIKEIYFLKAKNIELDSRIFHMHKQNTEILKELRIKLDSLLEESKRCGD